MKKGAWRILILCSFFSLGMGSCSQTVQEACRSGLPSLQKDLAQARGQIGAELASLDPAYSARGRALASVEEPPHRYFDLSSGEKQKWEDWSTDHLKLVERYVDFARTQTGMDGARKPLSDLAENLVDFGGYADRGALYQMREALQNAQAETDTAARLGCPAAQTR